MTYEKIILELLERVSTLESRVDVLEKGTKSDLSVSELEHGAKTEMVVNYIKKVLNEAKLRGKKEIILKAGELQKEVGLKNRIVLVCNAMRKCMDSKSEIIRETPSGNSTTLEVKYIL